VSESATLIEIVVEMASTRKANASLLAAVKDVPPE
jgi:hypothetical protein